MVFYECSANINTLEQRQEIPSSANFPPSRYLALQCRHLDLRLSRIFYKANTSGEIDWNQSMHCYC